MDDLKYNHHSQIYVLAVCNNDDAADLVAIGGEHSVEVLRVTDEAACESVARFHIGTRITALAWSYRSISPSVSDNWLLELTAAGANFGLHVLTKSPTEESIFSFGGGLSGHHGKVNAMSFCGGRNEDSSRYVGTVSDDKTLLVWDLNPTIDIPSSQGSRSPSLIRTQPTAYPIEFRHPLTSISAHPSTSKSFLVGDCRGSLFVTDWRSDPDVLERDSRRSLELTEPHALSDATLGLASHWSGSVDWKKDTPDIIGAVYGTKFSIWDLNNLHGGKPTASGTSFPEGAHKFRWCETYPEYFAISTQSPSKGAIINVHNANYLHAQPTPFEISRPPHFVRDFDFLPMKGIPRLAVAVGKSLLIVAIGVDA